MLPKQNKLTTPEVDKVFKKGVFLASGNLSLRYLTTNTNIKPKVSFVIPKSVSKNAVYRNKAKRVGFMLIQPHLKNLPAGFMGVFIYKNQIPDTMAAEIEQIIRKIPQK